MNEKVLELLEVKWRDLYQVYDMIDRDTPGYEEIEKQIAALGIVIEMFR